MALSVGTNCGFVASRPTADPTDGTTAENTIDGGCIAGKFTSPASSVTLSEIGAYIINATEAANMQFGIYSHDSGNDRPLVSLATSGDIAKGTTAGWKYASISYTLSPSTVYWLAIQLDATATATTHPYATSTGARDSVISTATSLPATWADGSPFEFSNELTCIYGLYTSGIAIAYVRGG